MIKNKDISIRNKELFGDVLEASDSHLETVMRKVVNGDFSFGTVTIKLNLSVAMEEREVAVSVGDSIIERYKRPVIDYSVQSSLQQRFKSDYKVNTDKLYIANEDGDLRVGKISDNQVSMFEKGIE